MSASQHITKPFDLIQAGRVHIAGGIPSTIPDVPASVVFLVLYVLGAVGNVAMFIRYGKRLKWQMALFGYCMSRITTMILRIAWSQHPDNGNLAVASLVFLNAGVLLIFLINLMMTKKLIFRTHHFYFQEHPHKKQILKRLFAIAGFLLLAFLILTITAAIQGFLTLDPRLQSIDNTLKRVGITAFLVYSALPFPLVAANAVARYRRGKPTEFLDRKLLPPGIGNKSWQKNREVLYNSLIILAVSTLVTFEYAIKVVAVYTPADTEHWYLRKGAFYATSLVPELLAMFILLLANMSKRYCGFALMPLETRVEDHLEASAQVDDDATLRHGGGAAKKTESSS